MRLDDTFIGTGSLLSCCAYTLLRAAEEHPDRDYGIGSIVKCKLSGGRRSHTMILPSNGVWRWLDPMAAELEERERLLREGKLIDHVSGRPRY